MVVKPEPHPASLDPDTLLAACRVERTRGSGPGGQHRNKVETAVRLTHLPTGISGQAAERRSQLENRNMALKRLRLNLALQVRCQMMPQGPSALWRSRRQGRQLPVNPQHRDFPALLAEAMDAVAGCGYDVAAAGRTLGISTSQLIKLLKLEPAALAQVNTARQQQGQALLK